MLAHTHTYAHAHTHTVRERHDDASLFSAGPVCELQNLRATKNERKFLKYTSAAPRILRWRVGGGQTKKWKLSRPRRSPSNDTGLNGKTRSGGTTPVRCARPFVSLALARLPRRFRYLFNLVVAAAQSASNCPAENTPKVPEVRPPPPLHPFSKCLRS